MIKENKLREALIWKTSWAGIPLARAIERIGCVIFGIIQPGDFVEERKNENRNNHDDEGEEDNDDGAPDMPGARKLSHDPERTATRMPPRMIFTRSILS